MKVAVVYWTGTGNTQMMAEAVVEGIQAAGGEAQLYYASDFTPEMVAEVDALAFGCPSMGAEVLEESEFEPMFEDVAPHLGGKPVALFGSYGWGDGEWMRNWQEECESKNIQLVADGYIANETPGDAELQDCRNLGKELVK